VSFDLGRESTLVKMRLNEKRERLLSITLINSNTLPTTVTVLSKDIVEAVEAEGFTALHDVSHPTKLGRTLDALEMMHVPGRTLGLCALIGEYNLLCKKRKRMIFVVDLITFVNL
jgi:hypothetical protein